MLLAGLRRKMTFAESASVIPAMWAEFMQMGELPGQQGRVAYGAMGGTDETAGTLDYMCAVEVESFDGLADGIGRMRVPTARYAVFTPEGGVASVPRLWDRIMGEWQPASGYAHAPSPSFERYDETFTPGGSGGI